jgi:hypothetical protein
VRFEMMNESSPTDLLDYPAPDSLGVPLIYIYNRYPRCMKPTVWFGLAILVACTLGASWAKSVDALIVLQGVGPGLAGALCAFPVIRWVPEWVKEVRYLFMGVDRVDPCKDGSTNARVWPWASCSPEEVSVER